MSDYTSEEEAILNEIYATRHVTGIKDLGLLGKTKELEENLQGWNDAYEDLEAEVAELQDKNFALEKEVTELRTNLRDESKVNARELAELRVELQRAHQIITTMISKYQPKPRKSRVAPATDPVAVPDSSLPSPGTSESTT
ncbi:hypothetical protein TWF694_011124 [Orbilia ellipsospora]|uniref:Uncharacterized protein n=1 Tax=Orbilia ellipsospora TaxID=2528407 RepID=A0AAV9X990_9PEZI